MGAPLITAHHLLTRVPATEATADLIEYKKEEASRHRQRERAREGERKVERQRDGVKKID